nr:mucin-2-like [Penaeus vannamei]
MTQWEVDVASYFGEGGKKLAKSLLRLFEDASQDVEEVNASCTVPKVNIIDKIASLKLQYLHLQDQNVGKQEKMMAHSHHPAHRESSTHPTTHSNLHQIVTNNTLSQDHYRHPPIQLPLEHSRADLPPLEIHNPNSTIIPKQDLLTTNKTITNIKTQSPAPSCSTTPQSSTMQVPHTLTHALASKAHSHYDTNDLPTAIPNGHLHTYHNTRPLRHGEYQPCARMAGPECSTATAHETQTSYRDTTPRPQKHARTDCGGSHEETTPPAHGNQACTTPRIPRNVRGHPSNRGPGHDWDPPEAHTQSQPHLLKHSPLVPPPPTLTSKISTHIPQIPRTTGPLGTQPDYT